MILSGNMTGWKEIIDPVFPGLSRKTHPFCHQLGQEKVKKRSRKGKCPMINIPLS
jgi:hypothetical protein